MDKLKWVQKRAWKLLGPRAEEDEENAQREWGLFGLGKKRAPLVLLTAIQPVKAEAFWCLQESHWVDGSGSSPWCMRGQEITGIDWNKSAHTVTLFSPWRQSGSAVSLHSCWISRIDLAKLRTGWCGTSECRLGKGGTPPKVPCYHKGHHSKQHVTSPFHLVPAPHKNLVFCADNLQHGAFQQLHALCRGTAAHPVLQAPTCRHPPSVCAVPAPALSQAWVSAGRSLCHREGGSFASIWGFFSAADCHTRVASCFQTTLPRPGLTDSPSLSKSSSLPWSFDTLIAGTSASAKASWIIHGIDGEGN